MYRIGTSYTIIINSISLTLRDIMQDGIILGDRDFYSPIYLAFFLSHKNTGALFPHRLAHRHVAKVKVAAWPTQHPLKPLAVIYPSR